MGKNKVRDIIFKISEGVIEKLTDFLLWTYFLSIASIGKNTRTSYLAFIEADQELAKINYQSFKRALNHLVKSRFLKINKVRNHRELEITQQGKQRMAAIFPIYQEKRAWDKKLYLITYDIPENHHRDRDLLREYLKKIGAALLQESVWVTPYNPKGILADFVRERGLEGTILVSDLEPQGTIGGEKIKDLVRKVYQLDKLNERYQEFIQKYQEGKFSKLEISFAFYSILKDDPQLPFELLPKDWLGEKAYQVFKRKI